MKIKIYFHPPVEKIGSLWIRRLASRVMKTEAAGAGGRFSIIFVDDAYIRKLNNQFFKKDKPTDVIAFNLSEKMDNEWGEIYIGTERARQQAEDYGVNFHHELARLVIHGILHLLGYEDSDQKSRLVMKEKEEHFLRIFYK